MVVALIISGIISGTAAAVLAVGAGGDLLQMLFSYCIGCFCGGIGFVMLAMTRDQDDPNAAW